ncbi:MAG: UDP-2,3-diacylglucosamine hydrolase [Saprospiraceae bacterium]
MNSSTTKNIYFASDFHLGAGDTIKRERLIVRWLEGIAKDAQAIYLVGDVFDFWFEYKWAVPKGYVRLFGMLARLVDAGIEVHFLKGNHDMWVYNYFNDEIGMIVHDDEVEVTYNEKRFYIAHGDGVGAGEQKYKLVRSVLRNNRLQKAYSRIHPSWGLRLMRKMSARSRAKHEQNNGNVHDLPIAFAESYIKKETIDYFIMGHRHEVKDHLLSDGISRYINLGDWISSRTYAVWDSSVLQLEQFKIGER